MNKKISWIHLSDFHIRSDKEWEQDVVLKTLADDIKNRFSEHDKPDLLFLTGDIAFSGNAAEYVLAEKYIRQLLSILKMSKENVFIVPGNHDMDRTVEEDAFDGAKSKLRDSNAVDNFLANPNRRCTIFKRQKAFREFVNRLAPPVPPYSEDSFVHYKKITIGKVRVKVLLLDSAWLGEGGIKDQGSLVLGERQILTACENNEPPAIILALAHHPISWLRDFEQQPIENLLAKNVSIFFHGHIHRDETHIISLHDKRIAFLTAGATFESRLSRNYYGWGCIDLSTGVATTRSFKYVPAQFGWEKTNENNWKIMDSESISLPVPKVLEIFLGVLKEPISVPAYLACLLTGNVSEIPTQVEGKLLLVSIKSDLGEECRKLSDVISQLKQLLIWKNIWEEGAWNNEINRLLHNCQEILNQLIKIFPELKNILESKEGTSLQIVKYVNPIAGAEKSPILNQIIDLIEDEKFDETFPIIVRALESGVLDQSETTELRKVKVGLLLRMGATSEAVKEAKILVEIFSADSEAHSLAASCFYEEMNYIAAAQSLHKALDLGMDANLARPMALKIAGKSGDKSLVERVVKK